MVEKEFKIGRRDFLRLSAFAVLGTAAEFSSSVSKADSGLAWHGHEEKYLRPELVPYWIENNFPHLELDKNESILERVGNSFQIDPHILLALLIAESPRQVETSRAGAEGAFQIMPKTRKGIISEIDNCPTLSVKREILEISTEDLKDPAVFKGESFLAGVYLLKAGVPKGPLNPSSWNYGKKLEEVRKTVIRYNGGINCDVENPKTESRLMGERVVGIFELLKGSKTFKNISPDLAYFLGISQS